MRRGVENKLIYDMLKEKRVGEKWLVEGSERAGEGFSCLTLCRYTESQIIIFLCEKIMKLSVCQYK